jgi:hypothetical protein
MNEQHRQAANEQALIDLEKPFSQLLADINDEATNGQPRDQALAHILKRFAAIVAQASNATNGAVNAANNIAGLIETASSAADEATKAANNIAASLKKWTIGLFLLTAALVGLTGVLIYYAIRTDESQRAVVTSLEGTNKALSAVASQIGTRSHSQILRAPVQAKRRLESIDMLRTSDDPVSDHQRQRHRHRSSLIRDAMLGLPGTTTHSKLQGSSLRRQN